MSSEQKFEEAANLVTRRREAAQKAGDEAEWTKALIREVQLRTGLHGYETAVRFLKDQPWPQGLLVRTALELFYAQSLVNYFHVYSWEIQQRERVESKGVGRSQGLDRPPDLRRGRQSLRAAVEGARRPRKRGRRRP